MTIIVKPPRYDYCGLSISRYTVILIYCPSCNSVVVALNHSCTVCLQDYLKPGQQCCADALWWWPLATVCSAGEKMVDWNALTEQGFLSGGTHILLCMVLALSPPLSPSYMYTLSLPLILFLPAMYALSFSSTFLYSLSLSSSLLHTPLSFCLLHSLPLVVCSTFIVLTLSYTMTAYDVVRLSASLCHFWQCLWDLGSVWAERVGQGEVGGYTKGCKQHGGVWACL